jgi:hypothetical protein
LELKTLGYFFCNASTNSFLTKVFFSIDHRIDY